MHTVLQQPKFYSLYPISAKVGQGCEDKIKLKRN